MIDKLNPSVKKAIDSELKALEVGQASLDEDVRHELGRLSFTTVAMQEAANEHSTALANQKLVDGILVNLPDATHEWATEQNPNYFVFDATSENSQYKARKIQANVLWIPGSIYWKGSANPDALHPVYILGRRSSTERPDTVELLLSRYMDKPDNMFERMGIIRVNSEDMAVRDERLAATGDSEYSEEDVASMVEGSQLRVGPDTPGSFRLSSKRKWKYTPEKVLSVGIRAHGRALPLDHVSKNSEGIGNDIMSEFRVSEHLAALAKAFDRVLILEHLTGLDRQKDEGDKKVSHDIATPVKHEDSERVEKLMKQNKELKEALWNALVASGLFTQQEVDDRIAEKYPEI